MLNLESFIGETVNIVCTDGRKYTGYWVSDYTDADDNDTAYEINEDSIGILENEIALSGVLLFRSEIESIETV